MNYEIAVELGKDDVKRINKYYKENRIQEALSMTQICIMTFTDLIEVPSGYKVSSNVHYRTYIIELINGIENKAYAVRSIVMGDYSV